MALITCTDCSQSISDTAHFCPHCGYLYREVTSAEPISLVHDHLALFAPPLTMPLRAQMSGGLFGMIRTNTTTGWKRCHRGLDLAANFNDSVFAARDGQVVNTNRIDDDPENMRMWVRHMDPGPLSFVTRYIHVKDPLTVGETVEQGEYIAHVGRPQGPHLHFEIRKIVNTASPRDWRNENTEPLDPLPFLCRWDKIYHERIAGISPPLGDRATLRAAAVLRRGGIWVFEVGQGDDWPIIPLVALDEGDRQLITLLQDAYINQKPVRLSTRESPFFGGRRIITQARVIHRRFWFFD